MPDLSSSQPHQIGSLERASCSQYVPPSRNFRPHQLRMVARLLEPDGYGPLGYWQRFRPRQTCVFPEGSGRLALSDCHSQVSLQSRHVLSRVPGILTFVEIMGSPMSLDLTASSSCLPHHCQTLGPQTRDGKSNTTTLPETVSLGLVPAPELDTSRYRVVLTWKIAAFAELAWPLAHDPISSRVVIFLAGASQYCDSASSYRVPPQP